jgi:NADH-quinone oxidoreductase subunit J
MTHILEQAFFWLCSLAALSGALFTVLARNPIRSAMSLLMTIGGITGLFLALHAQFLAAIQLIVYAGAVVILFVFVIMLIGADSTFAKDSRAAFARVGASVVFGLAALVTAGYLMRTNDGMHPFPPARSEQGSIEAVGRELFTTGLVPFELVSVLFIVAVVGAVAVARGHQKQGNEGGAP